MHSAPRTQLYTQVVETAALRRNLVNAVQCSKLRLQPQGPKITETFAEVVVVQAQLMFAVIGFIHNLTPLQSG
jgi:hypothetical protein